MAVDTDLKARAQWLRSRIALAEDLSVVPSTQVRQLTTACIAAHGDLTPLASTGHLALIFTCRHTNTYMMETM